MELRCSLRWLWWGLYLLLRLNGGLLQRLRPVDVGSMMWLLVRWVAWGLRLRVRLRLALRLRW